MEKEIWKAIPNYPNYAVSNLGNIKNIKLNRLLKPFDRSRNNKNISLRGYMSVHLCNNTDGVDYKNHTVHSLVMTAFVGKRPHKNVINHINGIKCDNRLLNLQYCTQSYNRKEDFIRGRQSYKGEKNNLSKLTEKQVLQIIEMVKNGYRKKDLAKEYNISISSIWNIIYGHCWSYLTGIKK